MTKPDKRYTEARQKLVNEAIKLGLFTYRHETLADLRLKIRRAKAVR